MTNTTECPNVMFPDYTSDPPARSSPTMLVVASLPAAVSLLLWAIFEGRRNKPRFTAGMILFGQVLALAATAAQGVLVYRLFSLLECDDLLSREWVAVPLAGGALLHLFLIAVVANRVPRLCSLLVLLAAAACVVLEYLGRNVVVTSAVQVLVPIQQLYCVLLVTFLTHVKAKPAKTKPLTAKASRSSSGYSVDQVDPLERRDRKQKEGDECREDRWVSWWR